MTLKSVFEEKKENFRIFQSLLIYLACWCDDWKFSDLYSREKGEKGFILGKTNPWEVVDSRLNRLVKSGVPIEREDVKTLRQSSPVKVDRQAIIENFIDDCGLISAKTVDLFKKVVSKAIPLIEIHIETYHQSQSFANENIDSVIKFFVTTFSGFPQSIKYFPIWLSFMPEIQSTNGIENGSAQKWDFVYKKSNRIELPAVIIGYFFHQIPGVIELLEKLSPEIASALKPPAERYNLDNQWMGFRGIVMNSRKSIYSPFFDSKLESIFLLSRLPKEELDFQATKLPDLIGKYEYFYKNRDNMMLKFGIVDKIFKSLLTPIIAIDQIDYEKDLVIAGRMPIIGQKKGQDFYLNIPLKDVLKGLQKTKD